VNICDVVDVEQIGVISEVFCGIGALKACSIDTAGAEACDGGPVIKGDAMDCMVTIPKSVREAPKELGAETA